MAIDAGEGKQKKKVFLLFLLVCRLALFSQNRGGWRSSGATRVAVEPGL
jgi:hypothetical protein